MRLSFVVLFLIISACATDPYQVCNEEISAESHNRCLEQIRQNEIKKAASWAAFSQAQQKQQMQDQQDQQKDWPMIKTPIKTNCTTIGNQTNCTTY